MDTMEGWNMPIKTYPLKDTMQMCIGGSETEKYGFEEVQKIKQALKNGDNWTIKARK